MKLTYEFIKEQFEKCGYKLLSQKYINANTKLKVECDKGHQYEVTYGHFYSGERCPICFGTPKHTFEYIKKQFEKEGYELLSKEYNGNREKLKVECPNKHIYEVSYHSFQRGTRCSVCAGNQKLTYDFVNKQFKIKGYKLLSKNYKNARIKLLVECPVGHQYKVTYDNFQRGKRCPICWDIETHSRSEKDCLNVVKQIIPNENVIENDRSQIVNTKTDRFLELDIWIPTLNKAIEFNGEYWHDNSYSKYKDNQKIKQCKEKNINLLTIWYQNWINNREEQIANLRAFI